MQIQFVAKEAIVHVTSLLKLKTEPPTLRHQGTTEVAATTAAAATSLQGVCKRD